MNLPEDFVKRGLALAEEMRLFGVPLTDLTREELIATAANGWDSERRVREQAMSDMQTMRKFHQAYRR